MKSGNEKDSVAESLRGDMRYMGFILPDKISMRGIFVISLSLSLAFECFVAVVVYWNNMHIRFLAMEDLNVTAAWSGVLLDYAISTEKMATLLNMAEDNFFTYGNKIGNRKKDLIEECLRTERKWAKGVSVAVKIFCLDIVLIKFVVRVVPVFMRGVSQISVRKLPFIFEFVYPFDYVNYQIYFTVLALQFLYISLIPPLANCIYSTGITVMKRITTELKLLITSLQDLDLETGYLNQNLNSVDKTDTIQQADRQLRLYTKHLVLHHQLIMKKVKKLNKGIAMTATFINEAICIITCLSLYYFIKVDDILLKMKALSTMIAVLFLLLIYTFYGQGISDEADNLKEALYFCSWRSKPEWFKRSVHIMMTCTNKTLIVKPLGLYVLNLRNYSAVLNAAYSFFNVLKTVRN